MGRETKREGKSVEGTRKEKSPVNSCHSTLFPRSLSTPLTTLSLPSPPLSTLAGGQGRKEWREWWWGMGRGQVDEELSSGTDGILSVFHCPRHEGVEGAIMLVGTFLSHKHLRK